MTTPERGAGSSVGREILRIGLPSLGTILLEPIYSATDTAIIGHVGATSLASLGIATTVISFTVVPLSSLGMALTTKIAARSHRRDGGTSALFWEGAAAMVGLGMALAAALLLLSPFIVDGFGGSPHVHDLSVAYLRISALALPGFMFAEASGASLTGLGNARTPFGVIIVSTVVNVILEMVLVFGFNLGVEGSALGTSLAQLVAAGVYLRPVLASFSRPRLTRAALARRIRELLRPAGALLLRTYALVGALSGTLLLASHEGVKSLDSLQISLQVWFIMGLGFDALAAPAQVLIGRWRGIGDRQSPRLWSRRLLWMGLFIGGGVGVLTYLLAPVAVGVFTSDATLQGSGVSGIRIIAVLMPLTGVAFVADGVMLGFEAYASMTGAMICSLVAFVAAVLVGSVGSSSHTTSVWVAFSTWLVVRTVLVAAISIHLARRRER